MVTTDRLRATIAVAFTLSVAASAAGAQVVRGSVLLPDSATPAAGVLVSALDARGATAARALTTDRGFFSLAVGSPGRYSLRVTRIGFRPTEVPAFEIGVTDTARVRIVLAAVPVSLAAVTVRERDECRVRPDTGLLISRIWEEARKAILISQLSEEGAPLFAEWIQYERQYDATRPVIRKQNIRSMRGPTTHAFVSAPADRLAAMGYVVEDSTGVEYHAPDAEALLSESFAATHCFRPARVTAGADSGRVGVSFEPSDTRRGVRDLRGTFWLDRATAELRQLDFTYTNLPDLAESAGAGGHVRFLRLSTGQWLVSDWEIRMPRLGPLDRSSENGARRVLFSNSRVVLRGIQHTGGVLTRVVRGDSVLLSAGGEHVAVQLRSADPAIPLGGAMLTLEGTDYEAVVDASGKAQVAPVLTGRYRARASTPLMDTLGVPPVEREVTARLDSRVDTLVMPSAEELLKRACPSDSLHRGDGMLRGAVRDTLGRIVPNAAVTVSWTRGTAVVGGSTSDQLVVNESAIAAITGEHGEWRACGVPRDRALMVRLATDAGHDQRTARLVEDQPLGAVDLVARRVAEGAAPADGQTLVEFVVRETGGAPIAGSTLDVEVRGEKRTVVTGPSGRAVLADLPPGRVVVRARHVGHAPGTVAAGIAVGRNTIPIVMDKLKLPALDTVRVLGGRRVTSRLDEFETRLANHSASASITAADIQRRNPAETWQMLTNVPSVKVQQGGNNVVAYSDRGMLSSLREAKPCYMRLMIDGVSPAPTAQSGRDGQGKPTLTTFYDLNQLPPPSAIHGIEVFAGPASIPPQYAGSGSDKWCGLIAVWTK